MDGILIVGINRVSLKYVREAVDCQGLIPIIALDSDELDESFRLLLKGVELIPAFHDAPSLAMFLRHHPKTAERIKFVTTFFDELFPVIAEVATEFGFHSPPATFRKLSSKACVGKFIPEHVPQETALCLSGERFSIPWLAADKRTKCVLKPDIGSGGLGAATLWLSTENYVADICSAITGSAIPNADSILWVIQEHCEGDLLSLEGFVQHTKTNALGVSRRERVGFTEVANHFPEDGHIEHGIVEKMIKAVQDLVERSGFDNGYFHCEFLADSAAVFLIDANMGRLGGGPLLEQIALAYKVSPSSVLRHVAFIPFGLEDDAFVYGNVAECRSTLSYLYCLENEGVVMGWDLSQMSSIHTPVAKIGSPTPPIGASDYSWVGMLTGYKGVVEAEVDSISIRTKNGIRRPAYK